MNHFLKDIPFVRYNEINVEAIRKGWGIVQNTTVSYLIYYAEEDMFGIVCAIFSSQECMMREIYNVRSLVMV